MSVNYRFICAITGERRDADEEKDFFKVYEMLVLFNFIIHAYRFICAITGKRRDADEEENFFQNYEMLVLFNFIIHAYIKRYNRFIVCYNNLHCILVFFVSLQL